MLLLVRLTPQFLATVQCTILNMCDAPQGELELAYNMKYDDVVIPDAYERLILDCINGDQQHFVRRDELKYVLYVE